MLKQNQYRVRCLDVNGMLEVGSGVRSSGNTLVLDDPGNSSLDDNLAEALCSLFGRDSQLTLLYSIQHLTALNDIASH